MVLEEGDRGKGFINAPFLATWYVDYQLYMSNSFRRLLLKVLWTGAVPWHGETSATAGRTVDALTALCI